MTSIELASMLSRFAEIEGRHPRILIAAASHDEERLLKSVATLFADGGFDVDIAPPISDEISIARQVIDCDADILALIRLKAEGDDRVRVADLISSLDAQGAQHVQFGIIGNPDDPARDTVDFVFDAAHFATGDIGGLMRFLLLIEENRMGTGGPAKN
ncbi:methylmalonyl-CoA mutase [Thalassospira sp.]